MKKFLFFILTIFIVLIQSVCAEDNSSTETNNTIFTTEIRNGLLELEKDLNKIDEFLQSNIWYTKYNNHEIYLGIKSRLDEINGKMQKLKRKKRKKDQDKIEYDELEKQQKSLQNQIELLNDFQESPFLNLMKPEDIEETPVISTPLDIVNGFTYIKLIKKKRSYYTNELENLKELIEKLQDKNDILSGMNQLVNDTSYQKQINLTNKEINDLKSGYDVSITTVKIYAKKIDDKVLKVTSDIKEQMMRAFYIVIFILLVIVISFIFKYLAKKTITDNERYYMANKTINFVNVTLIILILLFSFLENVTYVATVVGFASAGIAIAMKDLFMSILGWLVIVFGGSFHVGDRIKVMKDGLIYVGDIVDISLLRMTIYEDVTLTSYLENRRAGRIIFIPNNYIFTSLLANYSHGKLKTVWDGVDVTITFDSNHHKAMRLIKEIVKKYSKGYTDISRKQLNQLRSQYSLKNTNVDPRIYSFLEPNGIRISCWYMTNAYATLTLRSNIFANIIDMINSEDDIKIAYPTQTINLNQQKNIYNEPNFEQSLY